MAVNIRRKSRGVFAWFFQRITAVVLAYFLLVHMVFLHFLKEGNITFAMVIERMHLNPVFWTVFYAVSIPSVLFHGFNGLYGVVLDYNPPDIFKKVLLALLWVAGTGLTVIGIITIINFINYGG